MNLFHLFLVICLASQASSVLAGNAIKPPSSKLISADVRQSESYQTTIKKEVTKRIRSRYANRFPSRSALQTKTHQLQITVDKLQAKIAELESKLALMEEKMRSPLVLASADANQKLASQMTAPIEIKFHKTSLGQAIQHYQSHCNINVYVDWKRLNSVGVFADTRVSLALKGTSAAKSLQLVLLAVSPTTGVPANSEIEYALFDGVVTISTKTGILAMNK